MSLTQPYLNSRTRMKVMAATTLMKMSALSSAPLSFLLVLSPSCGREGGRWGARRQGGWYTGARQKLLCGSRGQAAKPAAPT